jgi:hypothetical protein
VPAPSSPHPASPLAPRILCTCDWFGPPHPCLHRTPLVMGSEQHVHDGVGGMRGGGLADCSTDNVTELMSLCVCVCVCVSLSSCLTMYIAQDVPEPCSGILSARIKCVHHHKKY